MSKIAVPLTFCPKCRRFAERCECGYMESCYQRRARPDPKPQEPDLLPPLRWAWWKIMFRARRRLYRFGLNRIADRIKLG
jgi:hypothetical protein